MSLKMELNSLLENYYDLTKNNKVPNRLGLDDRYGIIYFIRLPDGHSLTLSYFISGKITIRYEVNENLYFVKECVLNDLDMNIIYAMDIIHRHLDSISDLHNFSRGLVSDRTKRSVKISEVIGN